MWTIWDSILEIFYLNVGWKGYYQNSHTGLYKFLFLDCLEIPQPGQLGCVQGNEGKQLFVIVQSVWSFFLDIYLLFKPAFS